MTSPYLTRSTRSEAEYNERRRNIKDLRAMASRKDDAAIHADGSSVDALAAAQFRREAYLIRWCLRQIAPMEEGPRQILNEMMGE